MPPTSSGRAKNPHSLDAMGQAHFNDRAMYAVVITDEGGAQRRLDFSKPELTVGRVNGNDIVLAKRNVSKQHARLSLEDDKAVVVDLNSTNGTWVNGRKITAPHPLKSGDKIYIADFIITLEGAAATRDGSVVPNNVSEPPPPPSGATTPKAPAAIRASLPVRSSMPLRARASRPKDPLKTSLPPRAESRPTDEVELKSPHLDPLGELMKRLATRIDVEDLTPASMKNQERWSATRAAIAETFLSMQKDGSVTADVDMREVAHTALHEAVGLGALDDVLSNETVQMVVVNGPTRVMIDTGDGLRPTALSFSSAKALHIVTGRLAAQSGRAWNGQLAFHGRLSFGPRLTILQSPLVAQGPVIEIRIGPESSLDCLSEAGWMNPSAAAYLRKATAECRNIVVVGPHGAGVTTLVSALARELPNEENTVVVEAIPDLDVDRTQVIALAAADAGISMRDALSHAARLRADHVVINGLAGSETMTALTSISSREPGHILGVHCASDKDAIESLVLAASCDGTARGCIAQMIGSTLHTVVAVTRGAEGSRVTAIHEVEGHEGGDVSFQSVSL